MANYKATDSELISIATAIREKAGISKQLIFPTEFVSEIENIPSGGGGSGDEQIVYWGEEEPLSTFGNEGDVYIRGNVYIFRDSGGKVLRIVNKDYVVTSTSQILSTHSAVFQKTVEGPAIAIECQTQNYYNYKGPVLISPIEDYVKYTANLTPWGSVEVDGITWYIGSMEFYNPSTDSPTIPIYYNFATDLGDVPSTFNSIYASALVRKFLELAAPSSYGSVYIKSNGTWEYMTKELNLETLNVTRNGTYNPPSGVDGYAPVTVNVSGEDTEPTSITTLWESANYSQNITTIPLSDFANNYNYLLIGCCYTNKVENFTSFLLPIIGFTIDRYPLEIPNVYAMPQQSLRPVEADCKFKLSINGNQCLVSEQTYLRPVLIKGVR